MFFQPSAVAVGVFTRLGGTVGPLLVVWELRRELFFDGEAAGLWPEPVLDVWPRRPVSDEGEASEEGAAALAGEAQRQGS